MKTHKNISISLIFYILTVIFYFVLNSPATIPYFACALIGFFFAHMSNRKKESSWVGNLLLVIGILLFLFPFIISSYLFWGVLYNLGIK